MQHSHAVDMLSATDQPQGRKEAWADLGCGTGTFTLALASLLAPGSRIIAVDKDRTALDQIPGTFNSVSIEKRVTDFSDFGFSPHKPDGILMANSLHYVQHQAGFIGRLKQNLAPDGTVLIVEYDTERSNPWVPYPVSFQKLETLFRDAGFSSVRKLNERPSRYNSSTLYSAVIHSPGVT